MPVTEGHVLLIPKKHIENIYEFSEEDAAHLFAVAPKIANALKDEFNPAGMNLLQNNGAPAGQMFSIIICTSSHDTMKQMDSNCHMGNKRNDIHT